MAGKVKRGGIWHLRMRVPKRYISVEARREIHQSLYTGDEREANARLAVVERQIIADLDARVSGSHSGSRDYYEAIARLASTRSWGYQTASELAAGPLDEILARFASLKLEGNAPGSPVSVAAFGGVERPKLSITEVAVSMKEWFRAEVRDKDHTQTRTWTYRWKRPASKVVELLGYDPIFSEITRRQAVSLRDALQDRIIDDEIRGDTAQKELRNLCLMWEKFHTHLGVDELMIPTCPFNGLAKRLNILDEESRKAEIRVEYLKKILAAGALDSLNPDTRDVIYALSETGCRQAEVTGLPPQSIHLDHNVPHIMVQRETGEYKREIKNKSSKRAIPLVGRALEAFLRNPEGFARFRGKGSFSAEANEGLRELGLLPDDVTIGGMRHSFETRLRDADVRDDHIAELMGHSVKKARGREVYGDAMSLEKKLTYHKTIMITPELLSRPLHT
jgi:integrase